MAVVLVAAVRPCRSRFARRPRPYHRGQSSRSAQEERGDEGSDRSCADPVGAPDPRRAGPALHALGDLRPGRGRPLHHQPRLPRGFFERNPDIEQVITFIDVFLIIVFLIDFLRRLRVATDDRAYLLAGRGWLDLISVVPFLRIARILRIVRVYGLVGRMGGPTAAMRVFFKDRASGGLFVVLLLAIVVLEFGSLAILWAEERDPEANITTAGDALWYSIVTMSTVGYGDQYPGHEARTPHRCPHHRHRRGCLRHPDRLPGQCLPGARQERDREGGGAADGARGPRAPGVALTWSRRIAPSERRRDAASAAGPAPRTCRPSVASGA